MKVTATPIRKYKVQSYNDLGSSLDFPCVSTMDDIDEQIADANSRGYINHVIYNAVEVRRKLDA